MQPMLCTAQDHRTVTLPGRLLWQPMGWDDERLAGIDPVEESNLIS